MKILPTQDELNAIVKKLDLLNRNYDEALRNDEPFYRTKKIYSEIKLLEDRRDQLMTILSMKADRLAHQKNIHRKDSR